MKVLSLRVPRAEGERMRRRLLESGLLRPGLPIAREGEDLWLPLTGPPGELATTFRVEEHDFVPLDDERARSYRELVDLGVALEQKLPRSFDVVGDVVLVRLPRELAPYGEVIGEALLRFVPGARIVAEDRGVHGTARLRELRRLAGTGGFRTVHRENGLELRVDLERAYFSPRLAREHALVASQGRAGERVLDLCAGIGPFALGLARSVPDLRAVAVDSNPEATRLLTENAEALGLGDRIEARTEEAEEYLARAPVFDRAILNLPHGGGRFLGALGEHVAPSGTIHYYEVVERAEAARQGARRAEQLGPPGAWRLDEEHLVHEYSPTADLRGYRFRHKST
jgi:tRNA (guanine37-N1)-methyltransferase